jgi:hypothetical protein
MPGFDTKRCTCGHAAEISVRHALLFCLRWVDEREEKLEEIARDLKEVLGTEYEATAAIRLTLKTSLLEQFKTTA